MRLILALITGLTVAHATPALSKGRKARVVGSSGKVVAADTANDTGNSLATDNANQVVASRPSHQSMETRPKRYITDGGNPAPGRILVTPMVGTYALSGLEMGVKGSLRILDHGFVPALNNSVSVEAEVFKGTWHGPFGKNESMFYGALGRWDFHLAPKWTAYGAAGLLQERRQTVADYDVDEVTTELNIQVGGMMIMTDNFRLRAEWDYAHASLRFGAVLAL